MSGAPEIERWVTTSGCGQTIATSQAFLDELRASGCPEDEPIFIVKRGTVEPCGHCTTIKAQVPANKVVPDA